MANSTIKPGAVVAGFGFLGMIIAWLLGYLNDNGFLVDEYLTGSITLPDLQICVIIIGLLAGVIVGVLTAK